MDASESSESGNARIRGSTARASLTNIVSWLSKSRRVLFEVENGFVLWSAGRFAWWPPRTVPVVCVLVAWVVLRGSLQGQIALALIVLLGLGWLFSERCILARINLQKRVVWANGERVDSGKVRGLVLWWQRAELDALCELQLSYGTTALSGDLKTHHLLEERVREHEQDVARVASPRVGYRNAATGATPEIQGGDALSLMPAQRLTIASGTPSQMLWAGRKLALALRVPLVDGADRVIRVETPGEMELPLARRVRFGLRSPARYGTSPENAVLPSPLEQHRSGDVLRVTWRDPRRSRWPEVGGVLLVLFWLLVMPPFDTVVLIVLAAIALVPRIAKSRIELAPDRLTVRVGCVARTLALADLAALRARIFPGDSLDLVTRDDALTVAFPEPGYALELERDVIERLARLETE